MKTSSIVNLFKEEKSIVKEKTNNTENKIKFSKKDDKKEQDKNILKKETDFGLTTQMAQKILKEEGKNELSQGKKVSKTKIFAGQFKDFLVLILLISTAISLFMGDVAEAISIAVIVLLNAILGFAQEYKTEKTLESLKKMAAPNARVIRDKKICKIPATDIVRGDLILVEAGDSIPADAVLIDSIRLEADESMLTGESVSAIKQPNENLDDKNDLNKENIIYMGTTIVKGHAKARVVATGISTQMGKISGMIGEIEEERTPLQKKLGELGKYIVLGCLAISAIVIATGVFRGEPLLDMLITGVSLAVAAVPEGLPAIVTIALALAVKRMVKRKSLIRKLHAVETLGCASIVCTDKTGTLTENKMTVKEVVSSDYNYSVEGTGYKMAGCFKEGNKIINPMRRDDLLKILYTMVICNNAQIRSENPQKMRDRAQNTSKGVWKTIGEPTEIALLVAAAKGGVISKEVKDEYEIIDEIPFDSNRKFMTIYVKDKSGRKFAFVKGGYDVLINRCSFCYTKNGNVSFEEKRVYFDKENERLAKGGMRVLGFAYKEIFEDSSESNLTFLGICGLLDPPRKEAKPAVLTCKRAGIKTVMITGDHKFTAIAIAKQIGIFKEGDECITGIELEDMSDEALCNKIMSTTVFARVSPEHKLRIVRAYKKKGQIVAMTGDGVNDAPAIKEADIGVSMGQMGSDVTKQASDVILLNDNFATLVAAVEEGRVIYKNIRKFIRYLLSCNIGEVITMFVGMLIGMPVPLLPMQILMINLVTDGLPAIALGLEPAEEDTMRHPPRKANEGVFSNGLGFTIIIRGILIGFTTLIVFSIIYMLTLSIVCARTAAFLALISCQLIHVFECKSETKSIFSLKYFNNKALLLAVLVSGALSAFSIWSPYMNLLLRTCPLTVSQTVITIAVTLVVPIINAIIIKIKNMINKNKVMDNNV